jgi:hypothetical protein
MSYNSSGTYTNATGATGQAPGNVVQSATWNGIHSDYATALTQVMQQLLNTTTDRNILSANGSFEVWQRGAGSAATFAVGASNTPGTYTADRWYLLTGANQTCTVAATAGISGLTGVGSQFAAKVQRNNAQTGTTAIVFGYPLDTDEIVRMRGNKVTLQFWVKPGANWPANGVLTYNLYTGTGSVAKRAGGFTNEANPLTSTVTLQPGGAAQLVQFTGLTAVTATATQAEFQFSWSPTGTAGTDESLTLDQVSIEVNYTTTTWLDMSLDPLPFDYMLQKCKRHYQKTFDYGTAPAQGGGLPGAITIMAPLSSKANIFVQFPVEMRVAPTITTYNPSGASANWQDLTTAASVGVTVDTSTPGTKSFMIFTTTSASAAANDKLAIQAQYDSGI